jgi:uncharacterized protein (TIGR03086 family)
MHDDLAALGVAATRFDELVEQIGEPQWENPTPCADWTVRDLVDHVVGGHVFTREILDGATAAEAMETAVAAVSVPDVGPVQRQASAEQSVSFARPGALERSCDHVIGTIAGHDVLRLRVHEIAIHGWDLDVALGGQGTIPDQLVSWSLAELARPDSQTAAHVGTPSAETLTGLLGAFGRRA